MSTQPSPSRSTSSRPTSSAGAIDTVLVVFADHQGRLIGKRTDGDVLPRHGRSTEGTENCDYLIACDLDYTPLPGFRWASYEQGYGDMRGVVDPATIRYLPWLDAHRAGARRPRRRRHRRARRGVAAADPAAPGRRRRATPGTPPKCGSEIEFFLFKRALRRRPRRRLPRPDAELAVPRGLQHPPDDEGGGRHRRDPPRPRRRRAARSSSPRARPAAASTRST